jgi:hypothetical protein
VASCGLLYDVLLGQQRVRRSAARRSVIGPWRGAMVFEAVR